MADALASGASVRKDVGVQVPPRAPTLYALSHIVRYLCCQGGKDSRGCSDSYIQ
jgi:hypothetical protein